MLKKLAIVTTHPIQYHAPLFALLASRNKISIRVFYTWGKQVLEQKFDPGFGKKISWDIPL
ncbi:MAG: glycosyltransferase family 1 protein, partial [Ferruginibacter sp.]